jgi:hypothetical protein
LSEYERLPRPEATAKSRGIEVPRLRLVIVNSEPGGEVIDKRTTVGIDLAKHVFAICVLDGHGAVIDRKVLRRAAFERWAESLSGPCGTRVVAMEACGSAHHWGRPLAARGHAVRPMAAELVVPFSKGGNNDGNDAEAIAIAARQPTMRFVPVKTVEQQAILAWRRMPQGWIEAHRAAEPRARAAAGRVRAGTRAQPGGADRGHGTPDRRCGRPRPRPYARHRAAGP